VTTVTEDRSESFGLVTERRHYNGRHWGPARDVTERDCDDHRVWYRALSLRYART